MIFFAVYTVCRSQQYVWFIFETFCPSFRLLKLRLFELLAASNCTDDPWKNILVEISFHLLIFIFRKKDLKGFKKHFKPCFFIFKVLALWLLRQYKNRSQPNEWQSKWNEYPECLDCMCNTSFVKVEDKF